MKRGLVTIFILIINLQLLAQRSAVVAKRPNVVFFLVDDLGWSDIGCNGSSFYETPNIDSFAKENTRFTDAYAACHVCSPTRASIMTGKYPARTGLTDWLTGRKDYPFQRLLNTPTIQQLPFEDVTLAETFRSNGYRTAIFGKWHLGEDSSSPLQHGFETRITSWNKGWPLTYYSPFKLQGLEGPEGEYLTDRLTTEALQYIEKNRDQPFFLYLSHFAVHDPIQGRADLVKKYEQKLSRQQPPGSPPYILESNPDTTHPFSRSQLTALLDDSSYQGYNLLPNRTVKIKQHQDNVHFAAMVENMDENFGRLIKKLKDLGLDDNTIIIFVSDNGGMSAANYARPNKKIGAGALDKEFATSNLPLRGAKGWMYEGGIRVPMIVRWPQQKVISVCHTPVISTDFYPTLLQMTGIPSIPAQHQDGVSIVPALQGKKIKKRALYWHFPHYSNHGLQSPGAAIRYGDYKLLEYYELGTVQLFNLAKDPGEQVDLALENKKKVNQLRKMLVKWRKSLNVPLMKPNPDHQPK